MSIALKLRYPALNKDKIQKQFTTNKYISNRSMSDLELTSLSDSLFLSFPSRTRITDIEYALPTPVHVSQW